MKMFSDDTYTIRTDVAINGVSQFENSNVIDEDDTFIKISYKNDLFTQIIVLNKSNIFFAQKTNLSGAFYIECKPGRYEDRTKSLCFEKCKLSSDEIKLNKDMNMYSYNDIVNMLSDESYKSKYEYIRIHGEGYWSTSSSKWYNN